MYNQRKKGMITGMYKPGEDMQTTTPKTRIAKSKIISRSENYKASGLNYVPKNPNKKPKPQLI